jgi:hypothetical protein
MSENQSGAAPFGVRLDAATLARLDAYAERTGRRRGGAAVRAIVAGLDALDGLPVSAPPSSPPPGPSPVLDTEALADALADRLAGRLAAAVADRMPTTQAGLPVEPIKAALAGLRAGRVRGAAAGVNRDKGEEAAVLDGVVLDTIVALAHLLGEDADERDAAVPAGRIVGGPPMGRERRTGAPDPRGEDAPGRRFADAFIAVRKGRGLSQKAAADAAGVGLSTLQRAEWGESMRDESLTRLRVWAGL